MNIAVFSHYFTPEIGAPSARIYDLSQQWLATGHQVEVATCFPNHPTGVVYPGYTSRTYQHENLAGVSVHRHWTYITPNRGFLKKSIGHLTYLPSALLFTNRKLRKPDICIGTSPTFFAAMAAAAAARRFRVPFIMEVRDLWPACFVDLGVLKNRTLIRMLEKWELSLYRKADRIVVVTEAFRENLIDRGVAAAKVCTILNGADENFWHPMERPQELKSRLGLDGRFVILYIGAHGISQALGRVLEAAALLTGNPEICFVFVGEGAEKGELVKRTQSLGLSNVRFFDPVGKEEVRQYYALADLCLVPLRDIPLFSTFIPSKMFEMLAMSKPVLASVRGEAADILRRSGGAAIVEPEDAKAIAQVVLDLHNKPEKLTEMGRRGRSFVIDHYSRRALAQNYARLMVEAIEGKGR